MNENLLRKVIPLVKPPILPGTADVSTDDFAVYVERCRKQRLPTVIENASIEHAAILIKNLLTAAGEDKSEVSIVSGQLAEKFYGPLTKNIEAVMEAGCSVKVIALCEQDLVFGNPFFSAVNNHSLGKGLALPGANADAVHFLVAGNTYRVEVDDEAKKAYASFNDQDGVMTNILRETFTGLWKRALGGPDARTRPVGAY